MYSSSSFLAILATLSSISSTLAWSPLFERASPGCLADNCLRAVTGTQPGQTQTRTDRIGDCSSIMVEIVTPDTVTVTTTLSFAASTTTTVLTTTTTTASANANNKRSAVTTIGTSVPAYASPCSGIVRYSSACSCAGITAKTITVAAPTVTSTVSITLTTTISVVSTSTSITTAAPPGCTPPVGGSITMTGELNFDPEDTETITENWNQIFVGYGVSENALNPSDDFSSYYHFTTLPGTYTDCEAITSCGSYAISSSNNWNIDLYWSIQEQEWQCYCYEGDTSSASNYNVVDSNIGVSYGYQRA